MSQSFFVFESSPWWLVLCLAIGALYAFLLYSKAGPWSSSVNKLLAVLRGLLVALIAILLLNPMLKQVVSQIEAPTVVLALDNSASIVEGDKSLDRGLLLSNVKELASKLEEQGKTVLYYTLSGKPAKTIDSISFEHKSTDLSTLLKNVENDFEGRNIEAAVLISDGIYNLGSSPSYRNFPFKVHAIGLGDTIPKKDIKIKTLLYNKLAFQGNKFPIVVELQNEGFAAREVEVSVIKEGKEIAKTQVTMPESNEIFKTEFQLDAEQSGFHRYTLKVESLEGEVSRSNNQMSAYMEIIEGKQKILVAMVAPHPDVKALVSALEKNQNYEVTQYIPDFTPVPKEKYDLVIINEAFDRFNLTSVLYDQHKGNSGAFMFVLGNRSNFTKFNATYDILGFTPKQGQRDKVSPHFNENFSLFTFSSDYQNVLSGFPPLDVPYGEFKINPSTQVLFYQRVGSIVTDKPLIAVQSLQDAKIGVVFGEGIWRWRLQEFAQNENTKVFDEFVAKLVQYLSTKEDKRKFRFYPQQNEYFDADIVAFEAEVYNNIYEPVYGFEIDVTLKNENGEAAKYSFVNSPGGARFNVGQLPQGVYKYSASANIDDKKETVNGQFTVKELQLESTELTARHDVLRNLSQNSGGKYFHNGEWENIQAEMVTMDGRGIIHTSEQFDSIIHFKWIFFLLVLLVASEWFIRKYSGSY